ncbi:MAG: phosphohistidine phosphatase SixA [Chloroflexi bacterium]|nr:phosphohistidine phosphatase SixA [Chloroflexota bacterium]
MNLYILRHGIAADRDSREYPDDDLRPLTGRGIDRMRRQVAGMNAIGIAPDVIITSPLARAAQTADIVQHGLESPPRKVSSTALVPESHPNEILHEIAAYHSAIADVMVVGHEPHLSNLVAYALTGSIADIIKIKKGALCKLSIDSANMPERARLLWALTPRHMLRMA